MQHNNVHAVKTGLREDNIHCYIKEIFTDNIIEFSSMVEMCDFLQIKRKHKVDFEVQYVNRVYAEKYEIRLEGDSRPWFYTTDKKIMNVEPSRYIITIYDNGEELIFNGARTIIKHYRVWNVSGEVNAVLSKLKILRPDLSWSVVDQMDTGQIEVLDTRTNQTFLYPTVTDVSIAHRISKGDVVRHIRGNGQYVIKYLRIRRYSTEEWPICKYAQPWTIRVTDKQSNHSKNYTSLREVASDLRVDRSYIKRCISRPFSRDPYEITRI